MMPSSHAPFDDPDADAPPLPAEVGVAWPAVLRRLGASAFRARFRLAPAELTYWREQGQEKIAAHARDFIAQRLAPTFPPNDGKQTPWRGHPVFVAQHATATCCRGCLAKWHGMRPGVALAPAQQDYVVGLIMAWLDAHTAARAGEEIAPARPRKKVVRKTSPEDETNQNRQGCLF